MLLFKTGATLIGAKNFVQRQDLLFTPESQTFQQFSQHRKAHRAVGATGSARDSPSSGPPGKFSN